MERWRENSMTLVWWRCSNGARVRWRWCDDEVVRCCVGTMAKMRLVDDNGKTTVKRLSSGIIIAVSHHRNRNINLKEEVIYVIKLLVAGIPYSDRATKFNIAPSRFGLGPWSDDTMAVAWCYNHDDAILRRIIINTLSHHLHHVIALSTFAHALFTREMASNMHIQDAK